MRAAHGIASSKPTVLVLRALGLGDLMTAVPALRSLRGHHPAHRLVLATTAPLEPLVREMPFVDGMVKTRPLDDLWIQLDPDDVAVNLHGRGPQSTARLLATSPSRLVAFAHPDLPATFGFPRWRRREHEVARWCRLLSQFDIDTPGNELALDPPSRPPVRTGVTVIHPGAGSPARRWPPDRWAVVARHLADAGEDVLITGSRSEVALADEVASRAGLPPSSVVAGTIDVATLASTVAAARRLLSSDTGPAHLATAYGTPSVVLFGPASPEEWGPPNRTRHRVLWKGRSGDSHGATIDPGLEAITVDEVLRAVDELQAVKPD